MSAHRQVREEILDKIVHTKDQVQDLFKELYYYVQNSGILVAVEEQKLRERISDLETKLVKLQDEWREARESHHARMVNQQLKEEAKAAANDVRPTFIYDAQIRKMVEDGSVAVLTKDELRVFNHNPIEKLREDLAEKQKLLEDIRKAMPHKLEGMELVGCVSWLVEAAIQTRHTNEFVSLKQEMDQLSGENKDLKRRINRAVGILSESTEKDYPRVIYKALKVLTETVHGEVRGE